jgi:hypothetical protein
MPMIGTVSFLPSPRIRLSWNFNVLLIDLNAHLLTLLIKNTGSGRLLQPNNALRGILGFRFVFVSLHKKNLRIPNIIMFSDELSSF